MTIAVDPGSTAGSGLLLGLVSTRRWTPATARSAARRRSSSARSRPKAASASRQCRARRRGAPSGRRPASPGRRTAPRSAPMPRPAAGPAGGQRSRPPRRGARPPGRRGRGAATKPRWTARASNSSSRSARSPVTAAALAPRCGSFGYLTKCRYRRLRSDTGIPARIRRCLSIVALCVGPCHGPDTRSTDRAPLPRRGGAFLWSGSMGAASHTVIVSASSAETNLSPSGLRTASRSGTGVSPEGIPGPDGRRRRSWCTSVAADVVEREHP